MENVIKGARPMWIVPYEMVLTVVVYTQNGNTEPVSDAVRKAIIDSMPPGTGVGDVHCSIHGPLMLQEKGRA